MIYENYESSLWDDKIESIVNLQAIARGQMLDSFLNIVLKPRINKKQKTSGVVLRTIHSAKGLESEYVFVIGLKDDKFPSPRAPIDEESHIMYVAVTRAKKWLWVSSIGNSRFFDEYVNDVI